MQTGLVTVVVPVYNTEKYLDRCIQSIVNQTYQNLEILIIDDGSPDNCPQMCDNWADIDDRIRVIHKKNEGLGMARNSGIENSTGEYICFFDSDDYVALDTIENAYTVAIAEKSDVVLFGMADVNSRGEIIKEILPESERNPICGNEVRSHFLPDLIDNKHTAVVYKNLCLSACSCLWSMRMIKQTNWKFVSERDIISEDSYSIIWIYKYVDKVSLLPKALYFYCENSNSLSHTYRVGQFERIKKFYLASLKLAEQQEYSDEVRKSISGLFLSFSISAIKQIAAEDMSCREKIKTIKQIVNDDGIQRALAKIKRRRYGIARTILFWAIRHKFSGLCYLLARGQNATSK